MASCFHFRYEGGNILILFYLLFNLIFSKLASSVDLLENIFKKKIFAFKFPNEFFRIFQIFDIGCARIKMKME